jgi:hypothetical protein
MLSRGISHAEILPLKWKLHLKKQLHKTMAEGTYIAFHRFGQAKFPDDGSILGSSQFSILPWLPQKMMLVLKGVKIDFKISNWHR